MTVKSTNTTKAFTLIELLVVIAIIALLLAILMPSLKLAKDIAKRIGCAYNLRSLAMAARLYADDNDGFTPSSSNQWRDGNNVLRAGWVGVTSDNTRKALPIDEQVNGNGTDEFTGLRKSQLWKYIENTKAWRCPTDPDKAQLRSYGMAAGWWGKHTDAAGSFKNDSYPGSKMYKKLSAAKTASGRFIFVDQFGYNLDAYFAAWYSKPMWWNTPNFQHGDGSVNAFADGHVEVYKMQPDTIRMCIEALEPVNMDNGFRMPQVDVPDSIDLQYYQRSTWGQLGWTP